MKRSSTTGASMEWPHGLAKTIKNDDRDSPRVQSSRGDSSTGKKSNAATHNGSNTVSYTHLTLPTILRV